MQKKYALKKFLRSFWVVVFFLLFFSFATSFSVAEEQSINNKRNLGTRFEVSEIGTTIYDYDSDASPIVVASIGIVNLEVVSQKNNQFKISFDIVNNSSQVQTNIKYGVFILPKNQASDSSLNEVDRKIYSEEISLPSFGRVDRTVEYIAPSYLRGEYLLSVMSSISSGLSLGNQIINEPISLKGSGQFVEIVPSSCYLTVEGGEAKKEYAPEEGISLNSSKERLVGICNVANHFNKEVEFTPTFEIYRRSSFGEKIKDSQTDLGEFQFNSEEEETISFVLPIDMDPQAYDVSVSLKSGDEIISNSVFMHYVLKGAGATIQNIVFDKVNYLKGETAKVNLFWTDSADQFEGSRVEGTKVENLKVDLSIKDGESGNVCGQVVKPLNSERSIIQITVPITQNCKKSIILASIKDKEGNILVQRESTVPEKGEGKLFKDKRAVAITILVSLFVIILIIFLVLSTRKRK